MSVAAKKLEYEINLNFIDGASERLNEESMPLLEIPRDCDLFEILDHKIYLKDKFHAMFACSRYEEFRCSSWFPVALVYSPFDVLIIGKEPFHLISNDLEIGREILRNE